MIGRNLKNYVVEEMLGKGGMGVVYRARDKRLDRNVALKVLPPDLVADPDRRRRFIQEAKAASAVNHPAIAQIYEIEEEGDLSFIVMEYVDGSTLHQLVSRKELDLPSAVEVGIQVADALARAHEAGIVHRDIKADNIMVTKDGHPKILDFGLAKLLGPDLDSADDSRASRMQTQARTQTGMILGTVAYMSPEQARGLPADRRSDIFSFGVVLYEMSTGQVPFEGASALDTMHLIAFEPTRPVTTIKEGLPYSLQKIVDRCLQKKPEERYQEMRQIVTDLKGVKREVESGVTGGMPILDRVRWWASGLSTRGVIWAAIMGAIFGAILVAFLLQVEGVGGLFPVLFVIFLGSLMFRRFRNRGQREMRRFVKKASGMKEIRLVSYHDGRFTVVADHPTSRTYLRLNALLTACNERLFRGDPMTLVIREDIDEAELRTVLSSPGVQYLRDDTKKTGRPSKRRDAS
ncbi:MAG TPA: protein kinase [Candidatus Polarisedimenticolia bacterium]|nr:protein kinase [Candidatus Polarisedimenticolia bacterium]